MLPSYLHSLYSCLYQVVHIYVGVFYKKGGRRMKNEKYHKEEEDIDDSRLGVGYCHTSYEEGEFRAAGKGILRAKEG